MPPTVRTVTSTILKPNGDPWADGRVIFTLVPGSYIPGDQFPSKMLTVHTDDVGALSVDLWCNEEGEENSVYDCQLPSGESFQFTLPASATNPVELTLLRAAGVTPAMPQYTSILEYINTDPRFVGPAGPSGSSHWADILDKPTTIAGYGITDAYTKTEADARYSQLGHTHAFSSLTGIPTTLAGYGLDTTVYTKTQTSLTIANYTYSKAEADGRFAAVAHTHAWSDIVSGIPTTLAGYGITNAYTKTESDAQYAPIVHTHSAADITSGTLPDARFPATLPAASGVNLTALNATQLTSGTVPDARFPATLPAASGVNLTALNATQLTSGTVPDARFPATLPAASGVNLTALNATNLGSGTVPDARFPATLPAASGANLTALNGTQITTGTVADARLSANIPLLNAANAWANTGTHAFSGIIQSRQALGAKFFQLADSGASNAVRAANSIVTSTSDWVFYTASGTVGSETYAEALRLINSGAYVQVANRIGIGTIPGYPVHITNAVSGVALNIVASGGINLNIAGTANQAIVATVAASATVPVVQIAYGATPGTGGYGLRIYKSGNTVDVFGVTDKYSVVVGGAALATTATDGFLYIPSGAGAPTGVPTAFTGLVPLYIDSTNKFLYLYVAGGWKKSTVYA